jgi:TonB-linked SusC/RagA family outer membrane protein
MNKKRRTNYHLEKKMLKLLACSLLIAELNIGYVTPSPMTELNGTGLPAAKAKVIKGKVVSLTGEEIIGASVKEAGTSNATITNADGSFSLSLESTKPILLFSFIGYKTQQVKVSTESNLQIVLEDDSKLVDEVVVIAYGTSKRSSFTGSVTSVSSEKLSKLTQSNPVAALQGMSAGINVLNNVGTPGADPVINIRGIGSMSAGTTPLYVVDGMPYDGQLSSISPSDIESISVLKDAAGSALYGSRAGNGVVIITTKKAKNTKAAVSFNANWGVSDLAVKYPKMAQPGEFFEYWWEAYYNDAYYGSAKTDTEARTYASQNYMAHIINSTTDSEGNTIYVNPYNLSNPLDDNGKLRSDAKLVWDKSDWDWVGASIKKRLRQEYSINVSGMSNDGKMNYLFSGSYLDDNGMAVGQMFKRYTMRSVIDNEVKSWLKLGLNIGYTHTRKTYSNVQTRFLRSMPSYYSPYLRNRDNTDWIMNEVTGDRMLDFGAYRKQWGWWNSLAWSLGTDTNNDGSYSFDMGYIDLLSARTYAEVNIAKGLKFRSGLSIDNQNTKESYYGSAIHGYYESGDNGWGMTVLSGGGEAARSGIRQTSATWNNILTYDKDFGKHHINIMGGNESYNFHYEYMYGYGSGISMANLYELSSTTSDKAVSSYTDNYNLLSYLGKVEYSYDNKYYASASYRRDGSSRFSASSRWGSFFSAGASWRISKEKFLESTQNWLNNLSIKASYGNTGNDNLSSYYAYQGTYSSLNMYSTAGVTANTIATPNLKWEKNQQFNTGIDFSIFNNKLNGTIEYFARSSKDLLYYKEVPLSATTGNATGYNTNLGNVRNSGLEITLNYNPARTKSFSWIVDYNITLLENKITYLPDGDYSYNGSFGKYKMTQGKSRYELVGPRYAGVDPETGRAMYWKKTFDSSGNVTSREKTTDYTAVNNSAQYDYLGSSLPKAYGALTNTFKYKDFDFSFMFYYSLGGHLADHMYKEASVLRQGFSLANKFVKDRWRQPGDITDVPRLTVDGTTAYSAASMYSDRFVYKNDYLRLRNVSLGYSIPRMILSKLGINSVRFYVTGDNLLTFGNAARRGTDPEMDISGDAYNGADKNGAISSRMSFTGGLQVSF